jgi:hypothetical protein
MGADLPGNGLSGECAVERGGAAYDDSGSPGGRAFMDRSEPWVLVHCESCASDSGSRASRACSESGYDGRHACETGRIETGSSSIKTTTERI